ncbi:MAG: 30S ribosome-binding factor RbfA [Ruminococcaceae bacterium]|nr:30S ribosome-binding factor RbfA [Oscillospiraceae bacterium]
MAAKRIERICEEVKRELSGIIRELKDPRLKKNMISVVAVDVTPDLKYAKAHVSVMGEDAEKQAVLAALKSAAGFVRHEISERLDLRITPQFTFVLDNSVDYGMRIDQLLHQLNNRE